MKRPSFLSPATLSAGFMALAACSTNSAEAGPDYIVQQSCSGPGHEAQVTQFKVGAELFMKKTVTGGDILQYHARGPFSDVQGLADAAQDFCDNASAPETPFVSTVSNAAKTYEPLVFLDEKPEGDLARLAEKAHGKFSTVLTVQEKGQEPKVVGVGVIHQKADAIKDAKFAATVDLMIEDFGPEYGFAAP